MPHEAYEDQPAGHPQVTPGHPHSVQRSTTEAYCSELELSPVVYISIKAAHELKDTQPEKDIIVTSMVIVQIPWDLFPRATTTKPHRLGA